MKNLIFTIVFSATFSLHLQAQTWQQMIHDPKYNFWQVREAFYKEKEESQAVKISEEETKLKKRLEKKYYRYERFMQSRVNANGRYNYVQAVNEHERYKATHLQTRSSVANWTSIGPTTTIKNGEFDAMLGKMDCITFHPISPNILFAGSSRGGAWRSTDGGNSWIPLSDNWEDVKVSAILVMPNNPNQILVICKLYSYLSSDGGQSWIRRDFLEPTIGIAYNAHSLNEINFEIYKLVYSNYLNVLFVGTNWGIFKSTDNGVTWVHTTPPHSGAYYDICFSPQNPSVAWIAAAGGISKSINGGLSFTSVTLPNNKPIGRCAIQVSEKNPNYIYVAATDATSYFTNGFEGIYKSTDGGISFTKIATKTTQATVINKGRFVTSYPNQLDFDNYDVLGGQTSYNWALAIDPKDEQKVYVGGVGIVETANGGNNWVLRHLYNNIHVDVHDIKFHPITKVAYVATDGGLFKESPITNIWQPINSGINNTDIYGFATNTDRTQWFIGTQDNGGAVLKNSDWNFILRGDLQGGLIDDNDNLFLHFPFYKYDLNGTFLGSFHPEPMYAPILSDFGSDTLFLTITQSNADHFWKTVDLGKHWQQITLPLDVRNNYGWVYIEAAPSNSNYLYAFKRINLSTGVKGELFSSTDGGITWTKIESINNNYYNLVEAHPNNPNRLFVFTGVDKKLRESNNGGLSWQDISYTLPKVTINKIVFDRFYKDGMYIATDIGVFYKNSDMSDWIPFNQGLPNSIVNDLDLDFKNGKIRAATFGRGAWISDLYYFDSTVACYKPKTPKIPQILTDGIGCNISQVKLVLNDSIQGFIPIWYKDGQVIPNFSGNTLTNLSLNSRYTVLFNKNTCYSYPSTEVKLNQISSDHNILKEDFESAQLQTTGWKFIADSSITFNPFEIITVQTCQSKGNKSLLFKGNIGQTTITSGQITSSLIDIKPNSTFKFDFARAVGGYIPSLKINIELSQDCGITYKSIYNNGNLYYTKWLVPDTIWQPQGCQDWTDQIIDLKSYAGKKIILRFKIDIINSGLKSQDLYLDNLRIESVPTIPIDLIYFQGEKVQNTAQLNWQTATERDNKQFIIERSTDGGQKFEAIGTVKGAGNSQSLKTYDFTDTKPEKSINYYRLKQEDASEQFVYSKVIELDFSETQKKELILKPNPVDNELIVQTHLEGETIEVFDVTEKLIFSQKVTGFETRINTQNLASGTYILHLKTKNLTEKFIKQ